MGQVGTHQLEGGERPSNALASTPLTPTSCPKPTVCQALAVSSAEVRAFDVLALDLGKTDAAPGWRSALFAFH